MDWMSELGSMTSSGGILGQSLCTENFHIAIMRMRSILLTLPVLERFQSHPIYVSALQLIKCYTNLSYYKGNYSALLPSCFFHQMTLMSWISIGNSTGP